MDFRPSSLQRPRETGELPLTSMIDVVFLLLIYFLVTSRLTAGESELASALAAERGGAAARSTLAPQVIRVEADAQGAAFFRVGEHAVTTQDALTAILRALPKDNGVFIRVSSGVDVAAAAAALQAAKDAGFLRVTYVPQS